MVAHLPGYGNTAFRPDGLMFAPYSKRVPPVYAAVNYGSSDHSIPPLQPWPQEPPLQDHFLESRYNISSQQALGLFLAGFILTFAGRAMWQYVRPGTKNKQVFEPNILDEAKGTVNVLNIYQNYNNALSSIYRIVHLDPKQGNALLVYVATCMLGYLSGTVVQGGKETWVRREETRIRANLVNRLQRVVQQSIRTKRELDASLKEELKGQIRHMLTQHGVPNADDMLQEVPVVESIGMQRNYFYEPTHRTVFAGLEQTSRILSGLGSEEWLGGYEENPSALLKVQKGLLVGLGAFTGFVLHGFIQLLRSQDHVDATRGDKMISESVQLKDMETWSLIGSRSRKNFAVMAGFFAMSAAASVGKTLLDGLREIEVTRLNARTELDYQTHNWLTQDPSFHQIAEREAARDYLARLKRDLPLLKHHPALLHQRVQAILTNVGRNSAPSYYPMTPVVSLVEARG